MFGVVPKTIWSKFIETDEKNRIPLQTNCLLLDDGESKIVIETGYGDKWSDKERAIYALEHRTVADALREKNIDPAEIDHVIVTHLHFDHAGGLTTFHASGEAIPVFSKAKVHVQKQEWDDALANRSTMTKTYLRNHLDPIAEAIVKHDGETEAIPGSGIIVQPMPGHTWGQQAVRFHDRDGVVCFPGDVMPTANHVGLAFSMGYDMEPYTNMLSKRKLLERAADEHWKLVIDHEPGHPVVSVKQDGEHPTRFTLTTAADDV